MAKGIYLWSNVIESWTFILKDYWNQFFCRYRLIIPFILFVRECNFKFLWKTDYSLQELILNWDFSIHALFLGDN